MVVMGTDMAETPDDILRALADPERPDEVVATVPRTAVTAR